MTQINLNNLSLTYSSVGDDIHAVSNINLEIESGESLALIGPSGCGKSSVLKMIAGLAKPSFGEVLIGGKPIEKPRAKTGYILQDYGLLPWKTVLDNAALGLYIAHVKKAEAKKIAMSALETVGIADYASHFPEQLSGGMKQRLAIARSLTMDTDIMLMDEPLSALDMFTREELQSVLLSLWKERKYTQVIVTHSIDEAVFLGRKIAVMSPRPGRIKAVIENNLVGTADYRENPEFFEISRKLRAILDEGIREAGMSKSGELHSYSFEAADAARAVREGDIHA